MLLVASLTAGVCPPPAVAAPSVLAAGHEHREPTPVQRYEKRHPKLMNAVAIARRQRGDRYQYGGAGPKRFDCSGLVYYAFRKAGFRHLPRTSAQQYRHVRHIKRRNLARGDLIFFHHGRRVYHVGIFLYWKDGHRVMLHAPSPGKRVQRDPPWTPNTWAGTVRRPPAGHHRHRS